MAFSQLITMLAVTLVFSRIGLTLCSDVKGSVSCSDCGSNYDFSGIRVLVKCDKVKKVSEAITNKNGHFQTTLPSDTPTSQTPTSQKCLAKILGGPTQIYARKENTVSEIITTRENKNTYTILTPLVFSKSCHGKYEPQGTDIGSSKTVNFSDLGLPQISDYFSFIPIIGIP